METTTVTLKVECLSVGHVKGWGSNGKMCKMGSVKLVPVSAATGGNSEENAKFFAATPVGSMEFQTINGSVMPLFEVGRTYLVTITPTPDSPV